MTKKDNETLLEIKRKFLKGVSLIKKIDESGKLGMTHRHQGYLDELDSCINKINELKATIKP